METAALTLNGEAGTARGLGVNVCVCVSACVCVCGWVAGRVWVPPFVATTSLPRHREGDRAEAAVT